MVEDSKYQHYISWSASGRSFIVFDPVAFAKDVLPKCVPKNWPLQCAAVANAISQ
jgi:hypothetical protein